MSDEEEDIPNIGDRKDGLLLVCMGYDKPEEWIDWLELLVDYFEALESIAAQESVALDAGSKYGKIDDWREFCETLGVSIEGSFWEGSMISGQYMMGWIKPVEVRSAKRIGKDVLKQLEKNLLTQVKNARITEIKRFTDLDLLIERTLDDRQKLISENIGLKSEVKAVKAAVEYFEKALTERKSNDPSALDLGCMRIAVALISEASEVILAGPLVLWSDGVVYALTSRGGVSLPADSTPQILIEGLKVAGRPIVEVGEMTRLGGWLNGSIYRKGTPHISGWQNVWQEVERRERVFIAANPEQLKVANEIHNHFKDSGKRAFDGMPTKHD